MKLQKKQRYLQIALNSTIWEAQSIIASLPVHERIIVEAGTPLIKEFGMSAVREIVQAMVMRGFENPYVVADLKTMDRADAEVTMAKAAGASAAICLGQAPLETVNSFIETCRTVEIDSMVDMMNIEYPHKLLRQLKRLPDVVLLHRGVDEERFNKNKPIPYIQINKILSTYNVKISIAGGDTIREVQRAVFNGADIVVMWKEFYKSTASTATLAAQFLTEIK